MLRRRTRAVNKFEGFEFVESGRPVSGRRGHEKEGREHAMRSNLGHITIAFLIAYLTAGWVHAHSVFTDAAGEAGVALTTWLTETVA